MKEFVIEDFTVNSNNSIDIEYYFYSELKNTHYTKEQVYEVFRDKNIYLLFIDGDFSDIDCIKILKHYTREYVQKKK